MAQLNYPNSSVYTEEERNEFAIGFANWCRIQDNNNPNRIMFTDRLLKIYTKEKGL